MSRDALIENQNFSTRYESQESCYYVLNKKKKNEKIVIQRTLIRNRTYVRPLETILDYLPSNLGKEKTSLWHEIN